jgi:flavoprotein
LPNFLIKRLKIPKCITSEGQSLDVGYNIFFNYFIKRIKEFVDIEEINIDISSQKNVIKLYSLAYDELNSTQFEPLIRNAWLKAGYDGSNIEIF